MSVNLSNFSIKPILNNSILKSTDIHIPSISDNIRIIDSRRLKDFKDQVFGGYKLSAAASALDKALLEDKLEPAMHWVLQLLLSGTVQPIWNKLISFASKMININNPTLPEFLYNKTLEWQHITENSRYVKDEILQLRNHPTVRLLLAEMIVVIIQSKKRKPITLPRIKKEEFIIDNFKSRLVAPDNSLCASIFQDGDPSEIRIAVNEMAYHLYKANLSNALYWLNWILEWEKINSKKYGKYECASRVVEGVDSKYYKDVIWLIWYVINKMRVMKLGTSSNGSNRHMEFLWKLYTTKFTSGTRVRKQPLLLWAILYLTEKIDMSVSLIERPAILFQSMLGIDKIIASLKSQEVHHVVNNELTNVIVENNYMMPQNWKELQASRLKQQQETTNNTKDNKTTSNSTSSGNPSKNSSQQKLNDIYKLDRMMYA